MPPDALNRSQLSPGSVGSSNFTKILAPIVQALAILVVNLRPTRTEVFVHVKASINPTDGIRLQVDYEKDETALVYLWQVRPEIWRGGVPDKADLDFMTQRDLSEKYDTWDNPESISKYLHHCTTHRRAVKHWKVQQMYEDLRPVIEKFESLLPAFKPATGARRGPKRFVLEGNSTMSSY